MHGLELWKRQEQSLLGIVLVWQGKSATCFLRICVQMLICIVPGVEKFALMSLLCCLKLRHAFDLKLESKVVQRHLAPGIKHSPKK